MVCICGYLFKINPMLLCCFYAGLKVPLYSSSITFPRVVEPRKSVESGDTPRFSTGHSIAKAYHKVEKVGAFFAWRQSELVGKPPTWLPGSSTSRLEVSTLEARNAWDFSCTAGICHSSNGILCSAWMGFFFNPSNTRVMFAT